MACIEKSFCLNAKLRWVNLLPRKRELDLRNAKAKHPLPVFIVYQNSSLAKAEHPAVCCGAFPFAVYTGFLLPL